MGQIFCPGPFYFFVFDLARFEMLSLHEGVEEVLGIPVAEMNFGRLIESVHPEDIPFMQACEKKIGEILFEEIAPQEVPHYKISYCLRIKNRDGAYRTILHQGVTYQQDTTGIVQASLIVHSDITHLVPNPPHTFSLIHMQGGESQLAIPIDMSTTPIASRKAYAPSPRELEILGLLAEGNTDKEIADRLFVSAHTVRTHRRNLREKLDCQNTVAMVAKAIRQGLI